MSIINVTPNGIPRISKDGAMSELLGFQIPDRNTLITDLIHQLDNGIRQIRPDVTQGALSNSHGDWYEWLLALEAWNRYCAEGGDLIMKIPNVSTIDVGRLYEPEVYGTIVDLKDKIDEAAGVRLISSNPDFVILNGDLVRSRMQYNRPITRLRPRELGWLDGIYKRFIDNCSFTDLKGYVSAKTSLRPDRRLQIAHEGSLVKAIYTHLVTREWILNPQGLRYFAIATKLGPADYIGLSTVATHSITTVQSLPERAVDQAFKVNSLNEAREAFDYILG
jgi:hypothetical protein